MDRSRLAANLAGRAAALVLACLAPAALAQSGSGGPPAPSGPAGDPAQPTTGGLPPVVPPGTTAADVRPDPGLPGPQSVDPAPGASGPYAGHSAHAFYDVDGRIASVEQRIQASLKGAEQKRAMTELAAIKSEEKEQIARHGSLLDWARENLNHRLDALLKAHPSLAG